MKISKRFQINYAEGVKKTESIEEATVQERTESTGKRSLKVSNVIIIVLLGVVAVLLYPKIFKPDQFDALRDEDGMISVAVLPFDNLTGNYIGIGNDLTIMLNLVNTENGEIIWTTRLDGNLESNYRVTLDRLSDTVRNYMEIKALEEKVDTDLSNAYPNSAEAYRHYIDGLNAIVTSNYESAIESLLRAYEIDTTFTFAAFYLAFAHNFSGQSDLFEGTYTWTRRAHELKNNLPPAYHPWIELWYACYIEDGGDVRRYCDLLSEAAHHSRFLLFDLGVTYSGFLGDYNKSIEAFEKLEALNEQWEDDWKYVTFYQEYSVSLLMAGRPEEADRIAEIGLRIKTEDGWLILNRCSSMVMQGDSLIVKERLSDLIAVFDKNNASESDRARYTGYMYLQAKDTLMAEKHYRKANKLDPENLTKIIILARLLITSEINIEEGLTLTEKGLNIYPDDWQLLRWKGLAFHKLGKHEEALTVLDKADEMTIGYDMRLEGFIQDAEQALASQNN